MERADPLHWTLLGEAAARCDHVAQAVLPPADARMLHQLYLVKGARATTAIEGNTLSEAQIVAHLEGRLELPQSQEYLKLEVDNVLKAVNEVFGGVMGGEPPALTPDWITRANRRLLAGLEVNLDDGVVPGEIPAHPVGLREQDRQIAGMQLTLAWEHFVSGLFLKERASRAMRRRQDVTLALGRAGAPTPKRAIPDLSPGLARLYAGKTDKTLTRDMNWLVKRRLLERVEDGYRAKVETMRAFRASQPPGQRSAPNG